MLEERIALAEQGLEGADSTIAELREENRLLRAETQALYAEQARL